MRFTSETSSDGVAEQLFTLDEIPAVLWTPEGAPGPRPLILAEDAARITVPLEFLMQWDDERIPRAQGLALFEAFASAEKTLHANPGKHMDVPGFEMDSTLRFFTRHLG